MKAYFYNYTNLDGSVDERFVIVNEQGTHIFSADSYMYQAYLAWVAEGNTPEPWTGE